MAGGSWGFYRVATVAAALALAAGVPAVLIAGQIRNPRILATAAVIAAMGVHR